MRIWIDLANSPHPLLFAPIARRLVERGAEPLFTVRDHAQTIELARAHVPEFDVIGTASPAGRVGKARRIAERVAALARWAKLRRPDLALSHNSYAQIVAARMLRVPAITAMDYEHQPANHLAFRLASRVLLPEPVPEAVVRRQGASARKIRRYPGLKESIYLGDFVPDGEVLRALGVDGDEILVVARTPPSGALYHRQSNPLFLEAVRRAVAQPQVRCVALTRFPHQADELRRIPNCVVPSSAVDSRSLMHAADLVLGAGGTMTREAALMGIPTYSLFAGEPPAVDRWLEDRGKLHRLTNPDQLTEVARRPSDPHPLEELRSAGEAAVEAFVEATLEKSFSCSVAHRAQS